MENWKPTKHGGFRRTRVAQPGKSAAQIKQRTLGRIHPRVRLEWRKKLGLPECPYVTRWMLEVPLGSVRVHHWLGPDDDRAFHDHPWWFMTLVLKGGYTDRSPAGDEVLRTGSIRFRPALHKHTVIPSEGGCWTVIVTGKPVRSWWFWQGEKFRKANKRFLTFGHHPCS